MNSFSADITKDLKLIMYKEKKVIYHTVLEILNPRLSNLHLVDL